MRPSPLFGVFAAFVCSMAFLVSNASVWAAQPGNYLEASVGFTRAPDLDIDGVDLDPGFDMALGVAYGTSLSENTRVEAEFAYMKAAWDGDAGVDVTVDGFNLGANFLYDVGAGSSSAKLEVGIGLGWTFFDEACVKDSNIQICADADLDDWNVQGILGGSYPLSEIGLSETGEIVVRYRMLNIGGFSSEDRLHVFTIGYRHHF